MKSAVSSKFYRPQVKIMPECKTKMHFIVQNLIPSRFSFTYRANGY